jgi:hypothetical protein
MRALHDKGDIAPLDKGEFPPPDKGESVPGNPLDWGWYEPIRPEPIPPPRFGFVWKVAVVIVIVAFFMRRLYYAMHGTGWY